MKRMHFTLFVKGSHRMVNFEFVELFCKVALHLVALSVDAAQRFFFSVDRPTHKIGASDVQCSLNYIFSSVGTSDLLLYIFLELILHSIRQLWRSIPHTVAYLNMQRSIIPFRLSTLYGSGTNAPNRSF